MIDTQVIVIGLHLLGVIIGMGGAFTSDAIFFSSIRDEKVSHTEVRFLKLGGKMVWLGLFIIVVSGLFIFSSNPEFYLHSSKFLSKMTIVAVLILNGLIFHLVHIPRFHRHAESHFPSSEEFMRFAPWLLVGGVISTISWLSALILGLWRGVPYGYGEIMSLYGLVLLMVLVLTLIFRKKFIPGFK